MKLTIVILLAICLNATANTYAQKVNLNENKVSLKTILKKIKKQTNFTFVFTNQQLKKASDISINIENATIEETLKEVFANQPLNYTIYNQIVVIKDKPEIAPTIPTTEILAVVVKGKLIDNKGQPLPGATVKVKGTNIGVVTDTKGEFSINAPDKGSVLTFSFVGFTTQEVVVGDNQYLTITLLEEPKSLSDIVVVGYSTQSRRKLISAVSTVSGAELNKRVATSPSTLLQGQLPGLQVTQGGAEPGAENTQLLVRGVTTFSGTGNSPLVIVDGIPGSIEVLNPNDIESVTLLKDAASAAIYGSRASNGVILVKTKRGKSGDFSLQYTYNLGINNATKLPKRITNSAEYMTLANEAFTNSNFTLPYTQAQIDLYRNATDPIKYPNHDGLTDLFQTAYTQNHYLNISGGKEGTSYSLGFGATNQPGIFKGNNYKKYTVSLALTSRVNKRITFGSNFQFRYGDKTNPPQGSGDQFLAALSQTPLYLPQLPDGRYTAKAYPLEGPNKNYVAILKENVIARTQDYYMQGNVSLDVDIIDGLKWENRVGLNYGNNKFKSFVPSNIPTYLYSDGSFSGNLDVGTAGLNTNRSDNIYYTIYSQFSYKKTFGLHSVSAFAGAQEEDNQASNLSGRRLQFPTNYLQELDAGPVAGATNGGTSSEWAIRSLYGSANYDFNDKYLLGASIRRDGTSRLPSNSRYGTFYSFSAGWRISQENFLKNVSWLNDLKIRGSRGELGNQNIGNYPYQAALTSVVGYPFGNTLSSGYVANQLVSPTLTWETTRVTDIGIDLTVLNNTLTFTADYFNKYTFNILRSSQIPLYVGLNAPTINNGSVRNKGLEFALQYRNKIGSDFSYNVGGNIQGYKNRLEDYGTRDISTRTIRENGHEIDAYYMYILEGIFQSQDEINRSPQQPITPQPGDLKIKDVNGDGKIDNQDRTYVDGKYPTFTYSGNIGANYKNFDFSAQIYGSYGQKIYVSGTGVDPFNNGAPQLEWRNRWTPTNPSTTMPRIYAGGLPAISGYASTYYIKDGTFVRLKNVQLGYTIPKNLLDKIGVRSFRVFVTGDNLFTISKYPGLDPERVGDGSYAVYPQARTFTFGASVQL